MSGGSSRASETGFSRREQRCALGDLDRESLDMDRTDERGSDQPPVPSEYDLEYE